MSDRSTKKLIEEIESLPVEDRILVAESVLNTLNPADPETDKLWLEVAEQRVDELKSGTATAIPGDDVFSKIQQRFSK
ncbi:MAG: addiction module protein [Balneolaceae bacterium]|jgi:hypothetical protein|nr:MAG: addiction module protein [Balneolaceae bacterium]